MRAASRCTAPMNAPWPPPTMPSRSRRDTVPSDFPSIAMSADPQQFAVGRLVDAAGGEIVERAGRGGNQVSGDERRALGGALFGVLDAALPLQHRPALEAVLG